MAQLSDDEAATLAALQAKANAPDDDDGAPAEVVEVAGDVAAEVGSSVAEAVADVAEQVAAVVAAEVGEAHQQAHANAQYAEDRAHAAEVETVQQQVYAEQDRADAAEQLADLAVSVVTAELVDDAPPVDVEPGAVEVVDELGQPDAPVEADELPATTGPSGHPWFRARTPWWRKGVGA